ncbi:DHA2 family efflux MFS transporter permease subunit [Desertimonas flava]|uniref:DHA2 family efflux MFS transporter permease subunit n=1 Tax=Desertimonas flava TaxID=2064846 RepID=UPI000E344A5B|nr:DHA2 family efflux MFS transporter permease subunit [Desertimonas flava]
MNAIPQIFEEESEALITDPRRRRRILVAMLTALVAVIASVSALNVAQQELAVDLGASHSMLLWVINGYTLALAALLLPIGAIGDRWGRRHVLNAGLVLFVVSSIGAALATSAAVLLVARVASGVAAAMIMPVTLSVITSTFPAEDRGRAVGLWAGFAGAGGIIGLWASAFVIDRYSWPWVFVLPAALAVVALALSVTSVPNSREQQAGRFDVAGALLSAVAVGGLVLAIHEGPERGWSDPISLVSLAAGAIALLCFVAHEMRTENPLLDVRILTNRSVAAGSLTMLMMFAVLFGVFLVGIQYLQAVLGYSALRSAAGLLPIAAVMMPLSNVAPRLAARFGTRLILTSGLVAFGTGLVMLATMPSVDGGYWSVAPGLAVVGLGMGLAMTPSSTAITESLPADRQGVASALNDTVREIGGAVGVALLGSILNAAYSDAVSPAVDGLPADTAHTVEDGIGPALAAAREMGPAGESVASAARAAFVSAWSNAMWAGVAIAGIGLAWVVLRGPARRTERRTTEGIADTPSAHPTLDLVLDDRQPVGV